MDKLEIFLKDDTITKSQESMKKFVDEYFDVIETQNLTEDQKIELHVFAMRDQNSAQPIKRMICFKPKKGDTGGEMRVMKFNNIVTVFFG